ncbi:MAG: uracil-DNA glycosylase [Deltaproteobacteria bacterium]|nr:uracil-DNA glycosylase [Deltaproteobacteria bacterium]
MNVGAEAKSDRLNCMNCRHFYITYEPAHPYGCRSMNFKSKEIPSTVVFANSGMPCQAFVAKEITTAGK